ncbi:DNA topoisomerase 2-beta [Sparganum proliferum]
MACRTDGHLSSKRLQTSTWLYTTTVYDLLFAEDRILNIATGENTQRSVDISAAWCPKFGLTLNTGKTDVMHQPSPNTECSTPQIKVNGSPLKIAVNFAYLGSTLSRSTKIDDRVSHRISKASQAFGRPQTSVWSRYDLQLNNKPKITRSSPWRYVSAQRRRERRTPIKPES